jgi:choline dehydrogenase
MVERFDYVIAGAGSAGTVLAARLSEDPGVSVLLLEAGGADLSPLIHIPGLVVNLLKSGAFNWRYKGEPDPTLNGRSLVWAGGRVLGGSSSINGMVYGRGLPADYSRWAEAAGAEWDWAHMLPWFRKMESWQGAPHPDRGTTGPLETRQFDEPNIACVSAMNALVRSGVPAAPDYSLGISHGIGYTQATQQGGWRHSVARAYLRPVRHRPNLTVRTRAHVTRVLVERGQCVSLDYVSRGQLHRVAADRETILSLGAIGSPKLLLQSGIGAPDDLRIKGIDPVHDLPGVGRNLNEHVNIRLSATVNVRTYNSERTPLGKAWSGLRWLYDRKGPASSPANHCQGFVRTGPALATADIQIQLMAVGLYDEPGRNDDGMTAVVSLCAPNVRGKVGLAAADPFAPPKIEIALLSDAQDIATLIAGGRIARAALEDGPCRELGGRVATGPSANATDAQWLDFMRGNAGLNWHPTSTCRMGEGAQDVVGPDLRVRGLSGLSVADASIFPNVTSSNTNAPVIAVAEKAAEMIAGRNR